MDFVLGLSALREIIQGEEYKVMQSLLDTSQSQFRALQVALAKGVTTSSNTFLKSTHLFGGPSEQL